MRRYERAIVSVCRAGSYFTFLEQVSHYEIGSRIGRRRKQDISSETRSNEGDAAEIIAERVSVTDAFSSFSSATTVLPLT